VLATPLDPDQTLATLRRLRRNAPETVLRRGQVTLDRAARRVKSPQGDHDLTPKLCALLGLLMEETGRVVPRADIMQRVWETSYLEDTRTLDVHIRWLRRLIEPDPAAPVYLHTRRSQGYMFVVPDDQ
jgi:DNA-binding response OmpR family regulator